MTREEILKKAINKAENNGWTMAKIVKNDFIEDGFWPDESGEYHDGPYEFEATLAAGTGVAHWFLWTHNFAKAFWFLPKNLAVCDTCGAENIKNCFCINAGVIEAWKFHLPQMVLEEDPIKYLEKFL